MASCAGARYQRNFKAIAAHVKPRAPLRSLADYAAYGNQPAIPVGVRKLFQTYFLALARAVNKGALAGIYAGVQSAGALAGFKNNYVACAYVFFVNRFANFGLGGGNARHIQAVLSVGPPYETGAVKTSARR